MTTDRLTQDAVTRSLRGRFGSPVRVFDTVDSTNTVALRWARAEAPEGAVVCADHQTHGRGRWGRSWTSVPGTLLQFSVVLRPTIAPDAAGVITTALGVACAEGIAATSGLAVGLKWPNDVVAGGRKVAGILAETLVARGRVEAVVGGIGINVAWRPADVPEEIAATATSIAIEVERAGEGRVPARAELLADVLSALERWYPAALQPGAPELLDTAAGRSVVLGRRVVAAFVDGTTVEGRAVRLVSGGGLELEVDGAPVVVDVAEIVRVRDA